MQLPVAPRLWTPKKVLFTPSALNYDHGKQIYQRLTEAGLEIETLPRDQVTGVKGATDMETYRNGKSTMVVSVAPKGDFKLQPIPPSADYQFHLAEGCPGHCTYCYLAGSLKGPPLVRVYANLDEILANAATYIGDKPTTFEVSCYTDPLGIEHLTGSLAKTIEFFGAIPNGRVRWVTKYSAVDQVKSLKHNGHTRARVSVNAQTVSKKYEGGVSKVPERLHALRTLAEAGYPIGVIIAPIIPFEDWQEQYRDLFQQIQIATDGFTDITFELITHRFTPGSKKVLESWYPGSDLDLDPEGRRLQMAKFGSKKFVLPAPLIREMKPFFLEQVSTRFSTAKVQYWV